MNGAISDHPRVDQSITFPICVYVKVCNYVKCYSQEKSNIALRELNSFDWPIQSTRVVIYDNGKGGEMSDFKFCNCFSWPIICVVTSIPPRFHKHK